MPRRKDQRVTVRLTEKNRLYLQRLGIIDQHGRSVDETQSVSEFFNQCCTIVCEGSMNPRRSVADNDELRNAYAMMQYRELGKEIQKLMNLRQECKAQMSEEFKVLNT